VYHASRAVERIDLQLSDVEQVLRETSAIESFGNELEGIKEELDDLGRELGRLGPARRSRQIEASTTRPTEDQLEDIERAWRDIPEIIGRLNALTLVRIPALYRELNDERFPADPGDFLEVPRRRGG